MSILIIGTLIYFICGIAYMIFVVISEQTFDLGNGFVSNWIAYPIGLIFWWIFLYRVIKERIQ